ncbi:MAG: membrane protein insertion efficiency factor YidD [Vampirovibrionales bacterium]
MPIHLKALPHTLQPPQTTWKLPHPITLLLRGVQGFILLYRFFSIFILNPWTGPKCRFYPSCSAYALHLIKDLLAVHHSHTLWGKLKLCLWYIRVVSWRIIRCNPWSFPSRKHTLREGYDSPPSVLPSLK